MKRKHPFCLQSRLEQDLRGWEELCGNAIAETVLRDAERRSDYACAAYIREQLR